MMFYPMAYRFILGVLIFSVVLAFVWAIRGSRKNRQETHLRKKGEPDRDMLNFLQTLYAEGEIDKAEYEARKKNLAA